MTKDEEKGKEEIESKGEEVKKEEVKTVEKTTDAKADEECDPLTMDCGDMPDAIEELIRKEIRLEEGMGKLDELSDTLPDKASISDLYDELEKEKDSIHEKIEGITTHFAMCRPPPSEEDKEE